MPDRHQNRIAVPGLTLLRLLFARASYIWSRTAFGTLCSLKATGTHPSAVSRAGYAVFPALAVPFYITTLPGKAGSAQRL